MKIQPTLPLLIFVKGGVIGNHTITFTSPLETFSITHNAHGRDLFANGAIVASIWVNGMSPSLYSMRNVLEV